MSANHFQYGVKHILIAMTVIACVMVTFKSWREVYEVDGLLGSDGFAAFFIILLVNCSLVALFSKRARMFTLIAIVLVSIGFSLWQAPRTRALQSLRVEVARIVEHVNKYHADHGTYPVNLTGFQWMQPDFRNVVEYKLDGRSYEIWFNPTGDRNYGHYYSPAYGYAFEDD